MRGDVFWNRRGEKNLHDAVIAGLVEEVGIGLKEIAMSTHVS